MKRASMTIPDDLEKALEEYRRDFEVSPALAAVMQAALREYLAGRGYIGREKKSRESSEEKLWPRYPLFDSGDPTFAERDEELLAGDADTPAFGEH